MEPKKTKKTLSAIAEVMDQVRRTFQACTRKLGVPTCKITEVPEKMPPNDKSIERLFCEQIYRAYCNLNVIEQIVCIADVFERDSNYRFWYYGAICEKQHNQYYRNVSQKICKAIGVEL